MGKDSTTAMRPRPTATVRNVSSVNKTAERVQATRAGTTERKRHAKATRKRAREREMRLTQWGRQVRLATSEDELDED